MMLKPTYGWHFLYEGHKLRDGNVAPKDGVWLEVKPPIIACENGLHGSIQPFDALSHAPGPILTLCEFGGEIVHQSDKLAAQKRRVIARMDATEMLRYFARTQAMSVAHLWDAPDAVCEFLMTGDESLRAAAWAAARAAACDAARVATWAAARAAAREEFNALVCECFEGPLSLIGWRP